MIVLPIILDVSRMVMMELLEIMVETCKEDVRIEEIIMVDPERVLMRMSFDRTVDAMIDEARIKLVDKTFTCIEDA